MTILSVRDVLRLTIIDALSVNGASTLNYCCFFFLLLKLSFHLGWASGVKSYDQNEFCLDFIFLLLWMPIGTIKMFGFVRKHLRVYSKSSKNRLTRCSCFPKLNMQLQFGTPTPLNISTILKRSRGEPPEWFVTTNDKPAVSQRCWRSWTGRPFRTDGEPHALVLFSRLKRRSENQVRPSPLCPSKIKKR